MEDQQFCLKWSNHHTNMVDIFGRLLTNEALCDVTLACDGYSFKAHKLVLSASSSFFQNLFLENPGTHPIVILPELKYMDMKALVDFMYNGQVNISESQLPKLLKAAENLRIKGLSDCRLKNSLISDSSKASPNASFSKMDCSEVTEQPKKQFEKDSDSSSCNIEFQEHQEMFSPDLCTDNQGSAISNQLSSDGQSSGVGTLGPDVQTSQQATDGSDVTSVSDTEMEPSKMMEQSMTTDHVFFPMTSPDETSMLGEDDTHANAEPTFDMRTEFLSKLNELLHKKADNSLIFSKNKYCTFIEDVKKAKAKQKKEAVDYRRLKKYDVIEVDGKEKLIVPVTEDNSIILYYVHTEELFDLLHDTHLKIGHRGRTRMEKELQTKYKNVTKEIITLYLRLCKPCRTKLSNPKKGLISKPSSGIQQSSYEAMFGCKAKGGQSTSNLPIEVIDNLVTDENLKKVKQEMDDAVNTSTFSANEPAAVVTETPESSDQLSDNKNVNKFCLVCQLELTEACSVHSCGSCGKVVHAICGISNEADEGGKITCRLCHNIKQITNKRSAAHANLQTQGVKMLKNSDAKFPPAKVGDNVRICIPDVDRGCGDPQGILAVVMNIEGSFYKLGTEHGVLKQLYSRNEFSILQEKLLTLASVGTEEKSLRTVASSQSLTDSYSYTRCSCTTNCSTNRCRCKNYKLLCNSKCHKNSSCCNK